MCLASKATMLKLVVQCVVQIAVWPCERLCQLFEISPQHRIAWPTVWCISNFLATSINKPNSAFGIRFSRLRQQFCNDISVRNHLVWNSKSSVFIVGVGWVSSFVVVSEGGESRQLNRTQLVVVMTRQKFAVWLSIQIGQLCIKLKPCKLRHLLATIVLITICFPKIC